MKHLIFYKFLSNYYFLNNEKFNWCCAVCAFKQFEYLIIWWFFEASFCTFPEFFIFSIKHGNHGKAVPYQFGREKLFLLRDVLTQISLNPQRCGLMSIIVTMGWEVFHGERSQCLTLPLCTLPPSQSHARNYCACVSLACFAVTVPLGVV